MANDTIYRYARGATPEGEEVAFERERVHWPGLSAERMRISKPLEFGFRFQGDTHCLALADIVKSDGEITIDGFGRSVQCDFRDKLTFLPKGASIEGWSKFKDRRSSSLTIFLDPNADESGELRADDLPPCLRLISWYFPAE
jgi:AraC family transcriptional regulator